VAVVAAVAGLAAHRRYRRGGQQEGRQGEPGDAKRHDDLACSHALNQCWWHSSIGSCGSDLKLHMVRTSKLVSE